MGRSRRVHRETAQVLRRGVGGFAVFLATLVLFCPVASAGTYLMNSCNVPGRPAAGLAPWFYEAAAYITPVDGCARGGGFVFYFGEVQKMPTGATAAWTLSLPSDSPISIRLVRLWTVGRLAGSGSALFVGTNSGAPDGQVTNSDLYGPPGGDTLASPHTTSLLPLGTHVFRILLYCSGSTFDDCYPSSRTVLEVVGAEVTLLESVPPSITMTGGTLLSSPPSGTRTVRYRAVDDQSGVQGVDLLVDGTVAATKDYGPACPHADYAACAKIRSDELSIDTAKLTVGSHHVQLRVTDAAGNRTESPVQTVDVSNPPGSVVSGDASSAPPGGKMTAVFVGSAKRTFTVSYRARPKVRGRLTDANGRPVAQAALAVAERVAGRPIRITPLGKTGEDGRFSFRLHGRGSSRTVHVQYANGAEVIASPPLRLKVRASASLAVALAGVRVRYRGRVLSPRIPTRGVVVLMQGRRKGGAWQSFASRRVRQNGHFAGSYRLRVRHPGVVLQFRAVVSTAPGYPYARGASGVVSRTVR